MPSSNDLPEIICRLRNNNHLSLSDEIFNEYVKLEGKITYDEKTLNYAVFIPKRLNEMPEVWITNANDFHPLPHVMANGRVCYIDKSRFVFNQFAPVLQTIKCVTEAQKVLHDILLGKENAALENEFYAYWHDGWGFRLFSRLSLDFNVKNPSSELQAYIKNNSTQIFITDDKNKLINKSLSCNKLFDVSFLKTSKSFRAIKPWPPTDGVTMYNWLGLIDKNLQCKFLKKVSPKTNEKGKFVVFQSPQGLYVLLLTFSDNPKQSKFERLFAARVNICSSYRIDADYICKRNLNNTMNLDNTKIALIGAGSIGGYLADMLIRLGAGSGEKGLLTIVDHDKLEAGNIGRHRLGYQALGKSKVDALKQELVNQIPEIKIQAINSDAFQIQAGDLANYDLIIDATGEEAVGNHLCSIQKNKPLLSVWIEGNGLAARGLLKVKPDQACYHCIRHYELEGKLLAVQDEMGVVLSGGCRSSYVTYPVNVAVQAACLGVEMTLDWKNGKITPALRTRLIDYQRELQTHDCDPKPHKNCLACNIHT